MSNRGPYLLQQSNASFYSLRCSVQNCDSTASVTLGANGQVISRHQTKPHNHEQSQLYVDQLAAYSNAQIINWLAPEWQAANGSVPSSRRVGKWTIRSRCPIILSISLNEMLVYVSQTFFSTWEFGYFNLKSRFASKCLGNSKLFSIRKILSLS